MTAKGLSVLAAALFLLASATAQAELKNVSFRNTKDGALKLYCLKVEGRIKTSISCNGQPFTPDAAWEPINTEKVCFQHNDGRIRACDELSKLGSTKKGYICYDNDQKAFPFTPGSEWKRLVDSNKVCGAKLVHSDVIRRTELPPLDINWENHAPQ